MAPPQLPATVRGMPADPDELLVTYGVDLSAYPHRDCSRCGGLPNRHPTRHLEVGDQSACVDDAIADLVAHLWRHRCRTLFSCVGGTGLDDIYPDDGRTQLAFADGPSLETAYQVLADLVDSLGDVDMRQRLNGLEVDRRLTQRPGQPAERTLSFQPAAQLWKTTARPQHQWLTGECPAAQSRGAAPMVYELWTPSADAICLSAALARSAQPVSRPGPEKAPQDL